MPAHNPKGSLPAHYFLIIIGCAGLLLSYLTSSTHINHLAEIDKRPILTEQYRRDQRIAQDFMGISMDKTDFIHRQLLVHAAKRQGYTVSRAELTQFIQAAPPAFKAIFTANDLYEDTKASTMRRTGQKFAIESILEDKIRAKLLLQRQHEPAPLSAEVRLRIVPAVQLKVPQPSESDLHRYYWANLERYKVEQYRVRIKKIEHAKQWSTAALEAAATRSYRQNPLKHYRSEERHGYIIQCPDKFTEQKILQSLRKDKILPIELAHHIKEKITAYVQDSSPQGQALFALNLKHKYYVALAPQHYLVLTKVIPTQKPPFQAIKTQYLMRQVLEERKAELQKQQQQLLVSGAAVSKFLQSHPATVITLDDPEAYRCLQPLVDFLKKQQKTYGVLPMSNNVDCVFELLSKSSRQLSFRAALPQVQNDYLATVRERIIAQACQRGRVFNHPKAQKRMIALGDKDLPESLVTKILAAPPMLCTYDHIEGRYYIFQKLHALTPPQRDKRNPLYELSVLRALKNAYRVKIAPKPPQNDKDT